MATASAVALGGLWQLSNSQLLKERGERDSDVRLLKTASEAAVAERTAAEKKMAEAQQALTYERELSLARLEASRETGDRLFSWAMEKGHRRLPPLDGRELRELAPDIVGGVKEKSVLCLAEHRGVIERITRGDDAEVERLERGHGVFLLVRHAELVARDAFAFDMQLTAPLAVVVAVETKV